MVQADAASLTSVLATLGKALLCLWKEPERMEGVAADMQETRVVLVRVRDGLKDLFQFLSTPQAA